MKVTPIPQQTGAGGRVYGDASLKDPSSRPPKGQAVPVPAQKSQDAAPIVSPDIRRPDLDPAALEAFEGGGAAAGASVTPGDPA
jgi:hypothetical protein